MSTEALPPFVVVIPARLASTRLPNKPLADLGGRPLVWRVVERARQSAAARVVVAYDEPPIAAALAGSGAQCVATPRDCANGSERLAHAVQALGLDDEAIVVNVQGDEPLIDPRAIDGCAALLAARGDCAIATAAHALDSAAAMFDPNVVKLVCDRNSTALYFSRAPIPWARDAFAADRTRLPAALEPLRHVGLYAYRARFLKAYRQLAPTPAEQAEMLEQLRALEHGYRIAVLMLDAAPAPGVDTPADLERVRALYAAGG
jgi:3-deoxy-manno-octulosonate cytidylyltransferase (CMP-KDO synthetase)